MNPRSFHDLHITTREIERSSLGNLPFGLLVTCTRSGGWQLWQTSGYTEIVKNWLLLAGEYEGPDKWLVLDIDGTEIVDSRKKPR